MIALWDSALSCPNNRLKWYELIRKTESSAAISLKLKWRFSVTISFTLAMLTSVEDVDGRPERVKSCTHSFERSLNDEKYFFCKLND